MSDRRRVELQVADGVAELRLSRPDALNAIDPAMIGALDDAATACAEDATVRSLLISAEGDAFTVGGDLRHFAARLDRLDEELDEMIGPFHSALARLGQLPVPIVCAVQGAAAGGGLGLLWCADVVIAADDAKIATGFAAIALSGDGGSSWYLPRIVGLRRAQQLMLDGRVLSAAEARDWDLVSRVVPRDRLETESRNEARRLAEGPTRAYGEMRRLLRRASSSTLEEGLAAEREAMARGGSTADAREGIAAFVERRTPRFEGR